MNKEEYTHQAERQDRISNFRQQIYRLMGEHLAFGSKTPLSHKEISNVLKSCLSTLTTD